MPKNRAQSLNTNQNLTLIPAQLQIQVLLLILTCKIPFQMIDPSQQPNHEEKLLLALCRLDFSIQEKAEAADLLKEVRDWDLFLKLANEHGVIALEAYNLRELSLADMVPGKVMEVLDNARMKTLMRNTWQTQQWKEVNRILSGAGIKHVLLKGMALEHTVYRSLGLRQMTDTDILVKRSDALNAWNLLQQHGFIPEPLKSPLHRKIILDLGKHLPTLIRESYQLEIHHKLFREKEKNELLDEAIENAIPIQIGETTAYILEKDLHLEYLYQHNDYHLTADGSQLKLFLDFQLLDPDKEVILPSGFISNPRKEGSMGNRRKIFRDVFYSIPASSRLRFLTGEVFPSLNWMKKRHNCGTIKALLLYPRRIGKLFWLLKSRQDQNL